MFCKNCGNSVRIDNSFCGNCGDQVAASASVPSLLARTSYKGNRIESKQKKAILLAVSFIIIGGFLVNSIFAHSQDTYAEAKSVSDNNSIGQVVDAYAEEEQDNSEEMSLVEELQGTWGVKHDGAVYSELIFSDTTVTLVEYYNEDEPTVSHSSSLYEAGNKLQDDLGNVYYLTMGDELHLKNSDGITIYERVSNSTEIPEEEPAEEEEDRHNHRRSCNCHN